MEILLHTKTESQFLTGKGILTTDKGQKISFVGKDASKNGKFYVLRTWFTDDRELEWINGLVCL